MFWIGRKAAYSVHIAPGTYEDVLGALVTGGYFKASLEELLAPVDTKAVAADVVAQVEEGSHLQLVGDMGVAMGVTSNGL